MAKSRGRKFAEITTPTNGVFDIASVPTITNAKLQNSAMTLAGSSVSLGGTGVADTDALSEGSSNLYFTDARVQTFLGGGTLAGNIVVPDNRSIYVGSQSDFRIIHNTTNTQLTNTTGALQITSSGALALSGSYVAVTGAATFSADLTVDTDTLKVDSSNNRVGIGTASPASLLTINGNNPSITFENGESPHWELGFENTNSDRFILYDNNASAYRLIVDSSGNVGIGTTTPVTLKSSTTLQVSGNAKLGDNNGRGLLSLGDIASTGANVGIWRGAAGAYAGTGNYLNLGGYDGIAFTTGNSEIASQTEKARITTAGILQIAGGGNDSVGEINFGNTAQNANRFQIRHQSSAWYLKTVDSDPLILGTSNQERLKLEANGNSIFQGNNHTNLQVKAGDNSTTAFLQTVQGSDARFGTSSNHQLNIATNGQFRLSIKNTGQVGIGVTDPTQKLDVRGGSGAGTLTHAIFTGTSSRGLELRTRSDTSGGQNSGTAEINSADSEGTGGDLAFSSNGNVRMFIDGGGSVGIGTTNPIYPLHVNTSGNIPAVFDSSNTTTYLYIRNANAATGRKTYLAFAPANNIHGAAIYAEAMEDFSTSANRTADLVFETRNNGTIAERMRIHSEGHQVQQMDGKKFFKLTDEFTASANSTVNFKINVSDYTGASANGYCFYTVTVMGYASGGANGLNFTYTSAGYSGHSYNSINYNSYGAGTIANGASGGTQYTNVGLSYHPAVNLGGYIASGSVWVYVPAAQQYGVTVVNTAGTGMACFLTIEGWST